MANPSSLSPATYNSGLSKREVALIAGWERDRRKFLTTEDIRASVGPTAATTVTSSLVRKGVLERVERGVYLVRPIRSLLRPTSPSAPMVLAAMLHAEPYYLGGLWALTQHGLTDQQYVSVLDAFVTRVRSARSLAGARVVFHAVPPRAMDYGMSEVRIEEVAVRVSDRPRTLLDLLDYPRMVGGLRLAVALFTAGLPRVDITNLVDYAVRGSRSATCQRLGVLLERIRAPEPVLRMLNARVEGPRPLTSMVPGPRKGRVNNRWRVVENDRAVEAAAAP